MSDSSLQTKLRQAWYTAMVTIIGVAILALILEVAIGAKPTQLLNRVGVMRDGAQQVRLELTLLGRLLADDPATYPADLPQRLAGLHSSMARGIQRMEILKESKPEAFQRLEEVFREQFLPDFLNFSHPVGDQDRGLILERLKGSHRELETRLVEVEELLATKAGDEVEETRSIKFMSAAGGCTLGLIGLGMLFAQNRGLQKAVTKALQEAAPVVGADAKMAENIAKYAARIRDLETSNKTLRSEVDKLAPLADEVVTLRQQINHSPWEALLTAIHGRARSTLGKRGELGLVLELTPEEIQELEGPLRKHTEFVRITADPVSDEPVRSRHAVLVVEKDLTQRARLLACIAGLDLEVLEAASTEEGWSQLNQVATVRLCLVGIQEGDNAGTEFGQRVKGDPRHQDVEVIFCSPFMDTTELTQTLKSVAEGKTPIEEAQEKSGLTTHAYGKMLKAVNTETRETLTFARTALSHGQRNAAWNRISSLKETAASVGDKSLNNAIASVEREMDRGDVFFITNELERLERENQRLSKLAEQLLTSAPKAMSAEDVAAAGGTPGKVSG
jgi:CheY-like chemotaxis protein